MDYLDQCDVILDSPGGDRSTSTLLGNGDVSLLTWVTRDGDLVLELNKTDARDEIGQQALIGKIRIALQPNPFVSGLHFRQRLHLREGQVTVAAGGLKDRVEARLWVDPNQPIVRIEIESKLPIALRATVEGAQQPAPSTNQNRVQWLHRNTSSVWPATMHLQSTEDWAAGDIDPLLYRTFGAAMEGTGLVPADSASLKSIASQTRFMVSIHPLTARAVEIEDWTKALSRQIEQTEKTPIETARAQHHSWWDAFWKRSYIHITGNEAAEALTRAYARQRFATACADPQIDSDGGFRFDSARLHYWPMLASGDFAMMRPLFRMYLDALPMALQRTRTYFSHPGAFFPAAMHAWGSYLNSDYGIDRDGLAVGQVQDRASRYHWSGCLELLAMLLEHELYIFTEDFARSTLLPLADAIITFYDRHYPRVDGKLRFAPAQSLDGWLEAIDPLPEIAGLKWVLEGLLRLPRELVSNEQRVQWQRLLTELPPLPMRRGSEHLGANYLIPAVQYDDLRSSENPELAAVFPFRVYGIGRPNISIGRRTFERREFKGKSALDVVQAALLGSVDEIQAGFARSSHSKVMLALQYMLLQCDHERILVLPTWPDGWDVEWKLHAPMRTTVEGVFRGGELRKLTITPEEREKDVILAR